MKRAIVCAAFDNLSARHIRLLDEARGVGSVHALLWSDQLVRTLTGAAPRFPEAERRYLVEAVRYVDRITVFDAAGAHHASNPRDALPEEFVDADCAWVVDAADDAPAKRAFCSARGLEYRVVDADALERIPPEKYVDFSTADDAVPRVVVTGCFDWLHSGHVRFFEEAAALGDLVVVVGHDANIRRLKGAGHPLFPAVQRRYMAASIRSVKHALVATGDGWLDAAPEIGRIRPQFYVVNDDGDRPEKRDYCAAHGIEYRVFSRQPKAGLLPRDSTTLRGF